MPTPCGHGNHPGWKLRGLAMAVLLACLAVAPDAEAVALGRTTVLSALGEPLRAEVDLPGMTADEASTLQVGIASPDAFRTAGLDYNPLLSDVHVRVEQRTDGRTVLRLTSNRSVNEPFVDIVLQASWSGGRLLRGYTMLFDPPSLRAATPTPSPLLPAANGSPRAAVAPVAPSAPATSAAPVAEARRERTPLTRQETPAKAGPASDRQVVVRRGDTAASIARAQLGGTASLDQMLVALLRANPDAFVRHNVNRLKAGAVLDLPSPETVTGIDANQARQIITGQSRDFNDYRRRLAASAPKSSSAPDAEPARRAASGKVEAAISEQRPAATAPDKLKLSKGSVQPKGGAEDQLAEQRRQQASAERSAELQRNAEDLKKLSQATQQASGVQPTATAAPAPAAVTSPPPQAAAPVGASATASAPAVTAPVAPAKPTPPAAAQAMAPSPATPDTAATGWVNDLLANPLLPAAGGGLAVLLGAWAWLRRRKPAHAPAADSFLDSKEHTDSSFDASGGQTIDTSEQAGPVSSMMYSPSQLDAAGDVDPIAEADVYLAYGRDQQAEEILRDALRTHPHRLPLHLKLLEIFQHRSDKSGFELAASEVYALTQGRGPDWELARAMGQSLDPGNALYQASAAPSEDAGTGIDLDLGASAAGVEHNPAQATSTETASDTTLDFPAVADSQPAELEHAVPDEASLPELDLSVEASAAPTTDDHQPTTSGIEVAEPEPEPAPAPPVNEGLDFDFDLDLTTPPSEAERPTPAAEPVSPDAAPAKDGGFGLDFDLDLSAVAEPSPPVPATASPASPSVVASDEPTGLDFDLDLSELEVSTPPAAAAPASLPPELQGLSLDLETPSAAAAESDIPDLGDLQVTEEGAGSDPLETKLALAREFEAIGDTEGARALAEEVELEASGELQASARAFLAQLA